MLRKKYQRKSFCEVLRSNFLRSDLIFWTSLYQQRLTP